MRIVLPGLLTLQEGRRKMEVEVAGERDGGKGELVILLRMAQKRGGNANEEFLEQCLEMARGGGTCCLRQGAVTPGMRGWGGGFGNPLREGRGRR